MTKIEKQIDEFWEFLPQLFDIESREEFQEMSKEWNPSNPMVVALHHIWKRDAKVESLEQEVYALETAKYELEREVIDLEEALEAIRGEG